jgi:ankyrin repeat protein
VICWERLSLIPSNTFNWGENEQLNSSISYNQDNNMLARLAAAGELTEDRIKNAQLVEINNADRNGYTPLLYASLRHHIPTIKTLLVHGADPNIANGDGVYPIMVVLSVEEIDLLIKFGANAKVASFGKSNPLHFAASSGASSDVISKFVGIGVKIDLSRGDGKTPAEVARFNGKIDTAKCLESMTNGPKVAKYIA